MMDNDLLFSDDVDEPEATRPTAPPWNIVIIDDDREVHAATRLVLSDVTCLDRPLSFLSLHSAQEARAVLPGLHDIAAILLDVVMETDDAGLQLVRYIREELGWQETRIILRTGQPGSAPERSVITEYDINDYKAKAELTEARLFTTMVAALRSYRHLVSLEENRRGLRKIITAASSLHQIRSMHLFAEGVLLQLTSILGSGASSVLCTHRTAGATNDAMTMLASSGRFKTAADTPLDDAVGDRVRQALDSRSSIFAPGHAALYLDTPNREVVVYVEGVRPFNTLELSLLEMFGHNISIGYDNIEMYEQLVSAKVHLERRVEDRTRALSANEARLRIYKAAVDHSVAAIMITDTDGVILYVNPALARSTLYDQEALVGQHVSLFRSGQMPDSFYAGVWDQLHQGHVWRGELLSRRRDGTLFWEEVSASPVTDETGSVTRFVWIKDDISVRKQMEDDLRSLATTDPLTGALNRRSFFADARLAWNRGSRPGAALSAIMLDIDHFKQINDRHGHHAGDEAIRAAVQACGAVLREPDLFGRLGGEEFACVLPETSCEEAQGVAERLRQAVAGAAVTLPDGTALTVSISLGVATMGPDVTSIEALLRQADAALYQAKQAGRNCVRVAV